MIPDEQLLNRLETFIRLKEVVRSGWELRGVSQPESVADHSWGTAMLCLLLAPPELDRARSVEIALVHDLAEVETGDIPRRMREDTQPVAPGEKRLLERAAMHRLTRWGAQRPVIDTDPGGARRSDSTATAAKTTPSASLDEISVLWEEYEAGSSREACFARDMNLIDMCLQALVYERDRRYDPEAENRAFPEYLCLDEFFATSRDRITTELGKSLFAAIESRYRRIRDKREGTDQQ